MALAHSRVSRLTKASQDFPQKLCRFSTFPNDKTRQHVT